MSIITSNFNSCSLPTYLSLQVKPVADFRGLVQIFSHLAVTISHICTKSEYRDGCSFRYANTFKSFKINHNESQSPKNLLYTHLKRVIIHCSLFADPRLGDTDTKNTNCGASITSTSFLLIELDSPQSPSSMRRLNVVGWDWEL